MPDGVMQMLGALLVVAAAIVLLRAALALAPGVARRRPRLRVVESCALGGRQRLHIIEAEGERLLVGAGEGPVTLLRKLGKVEEARLESAPQRSPWRVARRGLRWLHRAAPILVFLVLGGARAAVAADLPALSAGQAAELLKDAGGPGEIQSTLWVVGLITMISVAPSLLLMATCFTRIVIVLAFLRQAIGIQQLPPSQVLVGLALFLTLFIMAPVGERMRVEALDPYMAQQIDERVALERSAVPVREFLSNFTRQEDLALFTEIAGAELPAPGADVPLSTLLPAYMLSELRTAFEIGFMIYLPFLVVDLMVASMLISMGMIVLPPIVISLPFKLMLFVLLDGWNLVVSSLVSGLR